MAGSYPCALFSHLETLTKLFFVIAPPSLRVAITLLGPKTQVPNRRHYMQRLYSPLFRPVAGIGFLGFPYIADTVDRCPLNIENLIFDEVIGTCTVSHFQRSRMLGMAILLLVSFSTDILDV